MGGELIQDQDLDPAWLQCERIAAVAPFSSHFASESFMTHNAGGAAANKEAPALRLHTQREWTKAGIEESGWENQSNWTKSSTALDSQALTPVLDLTFAGNCDLISAARRDVGGHEPARLAVVNVERDVTLIRAQAARSGGSKLLSESRHFPSCCPSAKEHLSFSTFVVEVVGGVSSTCISSSVISEQIRLLSGMLGSSDQTGGGEPSHHHHLGAERGGKWDSEEVSVRSKAQGLNPKTQSCKRLLCADGVMEGGNRREIADGDGDGDGDGDVSVPALKPQHPSGRSHPDSVNNAGSKLLYRKLDSASKEMKHTGGEKGTQRQRGEREREKRKMPSGEEKKRDQLQVGLKQVKRCPYTADRESRCHSIHFCPGCAKVATLCARPGMREWTTNQSDENCEVKNEELSSSTIDSAACPSPSCSPQASTPPAASRLDELQVPRKRLPLRCFLQSDLVMRGNESESASEADEREKSQTSPTPRWEVSPVDCGEVRP
ncbi:hypothetical protein FQN60_011441 [Etheostoma spectabile]|uniref:Uncharacterized protein n=1 Tax=Etheostoma spectabile TaxID=54343 RepID=A0A5J5DS54_9PERO|nr:hypothetical protein FQN60_011441 [Etheostoma spectabile]